MANWQCVLLTLRLSSDYDIIFKLYSRLITGTEEFHDIAAQLTDCTLNLQNNIVKSQMWGLFPTESTYLPCLAVHAYAARGRTNVLRGVSRSAAQPRSLEGT